MLYLEKFLLPANLLRMLYVSRSLNVSEYFIFYRFKRKVDLKFCDVSIDKIKIHYFNRLKLLFKKFVGVMQVFFKYNC